MQCERTHLNMRLTCHCHYYMEEAEKHFLPFPSPLRAKYCRYSIQLRLETTCTAEVISFLFLVKEPAGVKVNNKAV